MGYSIHIPLIAGKLKIKSHSRLRGEEKDRRVPMLRVGSVYLIWNSRTKLIEDKIKKNLRRTPSK